MSGRGRSRFKVRLRDRYSRRHGVLICEALLTGRQVGHGTPAPTCFARHAVLYPPAVVRSGDTAGIWSVDRSERQVEIRIDLVLRLSPSGDDS